MRIRRTDLAMEARELWQEQAGETTKLAGVKAWERERDGVLVTTVQILDRDGEEALGKPRGSYITLTLGGVGSGEPTEFVRAIRTVAAELSGLLEDLPEEGVVLVAGLGNRAITPDAIGPRVHEYTLATRHLVSQQPDCFGFLRPVASLLAEVMGNTGLESGQLIKAVCSEIRPACVIAVDALASRSLERLCCTVQLADTGIVPGSGVGNHRFALTQETLGVPVIAVGVPTVVDGATLAADLTGAEEPPELGGSLLVTPKDIDRQVNDLAKIIGYGIGLALQPKLTLEELECLLG